VAIAAAAERAQLVRERFRLAETGRTQRRVVVAGCGVSQRVFLQLAVVD
jgi:hypothetical protein